MESSDAIASVIAIPNQSPTIPGQINLGKSSSPLVKCTGFLNSREPATILQAVEWDAGSDPIKTPKGIVLSGKIAEIVRAM